MSKAEDKALEKILDELEALGPIEARRVLDEASQMLETAAKAWRVGLGGQ